MINNHVVAVLNICPYLLKGNGLRRVMRYNTRHAPGWGRPTLSRTPPRRGHDKYKRRGIIGECYNISEG
jgi:hypothetical protein